MSAAELVLRVVAVGRPVQSVRLRPLAGRAVAYVRSAPVSFAYLAILCVTTAVIEVVSVRTAHRLLLQRSTNLHQLGRDPARVLVSSAFWVDSLQALLVTAVLVVVVLASVERRVGGLRMSCVFAVGHVGASLLVAGGLWLGIRTSVIGHGVADARDVGASYGCLAVAGALTYLLPRRVREVYAAGLVGGVLLLAALSDDFTATGHVVAVLLGLACFGLVRQPGQDR